jgi:SAM-dependent methyltransferase
MSCRICGRNTGNQTFDVKEMMFGLPETFRYFECSNCGCLQISDIPTDMAKYYNLTYFSPNSPRKLNLKYTTKRLMLKVNKAVNKKIFKKYVLSAFEQPFVVNLARDESLCDNSAILEVGCGAGGLLLTLKNLGFKNLLGIEPYSECKINPSLNVFKGTLTEVSLKEKFDLIIFDHSFEHIPNQLTTLNRVSELLSDKGICLVRIPVKTDYIWSQYGTCWVQLDAPRHFFLHTVRSLQLLSQKAGLKVEKVLFDSTELQFWGSEQYMKNIPLRAKNSYAINPGKSIFKRREIKKISRKAKALNRKAQGDQATFI